MFFLKSLKQIHSAFRNTSSMECEDETKKDFERNGDQTQTCAIKANSILSISPFIYLDSKSKQPN